MLPPLKRPMASLAGLSRLESCHGPLKTMDRLVASVTARGMTVFARVDHGAGAAEAGLPLRPTELLIFGNARIGTKLMQAAQTTGIDLPLKVLVWQDEHGVSWLGFNEPGWIARRHGLAPDSVPAIHAMHQALAEIVHEVAGTAESPA